MNRKLRSVARKISALAAEFYLRERIPFQSRYSMAIEDLADAAMVQLAEGRPVQIASYWDSRKLKVVRVFVPVGVMLDRGRGVAAGAPCTWNCPTGETCNCNQVCKCSGVDAHGNPGTGAECECAGLQTPVRRHVGVERESFAVGGHYDWAQRRYRSYDPARAMPPGFSAGGLTRRKGGG